MCKITWPFTIFSLLCLQRSGCASTGAQTKGGEVAGHAQPLGQVDDQEIQQGLHHIWINYYETFSIFSIFKTFIKQASQLLHRCLQAAVSHSRVVCTHDQTRQMALLKYLIAQGQDFRGHIVCSFTCQAGSVWNALSNLSTEPQLYLISMSQQAGQDTTRPFIAPCTMWQIDSLRFRVGLQWLPLSQLLKKGAMGINCCCARQFLSSSCKKFFTCLLCA